MSTAPSDLSMQFPPGPMVDGSGNLTPQWHRAMLLLWSRTGYALGVDSVWMQMEADTATLAAMAAQQVASSALIEARQALDMAKQVLLEAHSIRAQSLKALETSQDSTILSVTAGRNTQAAQNQDESMIFSIMNR